MQSRPLWDQCIDHKNGEVEAFIERYFADTNRNCLLIAGAGFDPRAPGFSKKLHNVLNDRLKVILIREERPNPDKTLVNRAEKNLAQIQSYLNKIETVVIDIFADDGAVIGGRKAIDAIRLESFRSYTDVVIDLSALSIGISFPIVRFVFEFGIEYSPSLNVHIMVASDPELDGVITPISSHVVNKVHGFKGESGLLGGDEPAKLWLPQLSIKRKEDLNRIYDAVDPHDTCPILPFPSVDPKAGDKLAVAFLKELVDTWEVDTRNLVYADEENPLDLYRTILRINDERRPVFKDLGGSLLALSPLGSKVLAIGALMAALDRDLPVYYVEALGYDVDWSKVSADGFGNWKMRHIWLCGEAYPPDAFTN